VFRRISASDRDSGSGSDQASRSALGFPKRRGCIMETSVVFSRLTNIAWISIVKGK
jgi:hypothetical protein